MTTKTCSLCAETKPLDEFYSRCAACKPCHNERTKRYQKEIKADPERLARQKATAHASLVKRRNAAKLEKYLGQSSRCDGRECTDCGEFKPWADYHKKADGRNGRNSYCDACDYDRKVKWRKANPEKQHDQQLRRMYGSSREEYLALTEAQGGGCGICGCTDRKLVMDHNHKTGEVRGTLCQTCNKGIGLLQDSPSIVRAALDYLENRGHYSPHPED